ncbi:MAG: putative multicopper oxidase [Acidimicrobiales bacterium]|nr:putative multicopper oxidase [Acidimicrobiales bacterium]
MSSERDDVSFYLSAFAALGSVFAVLLVLGVLVGRATGGGASSAAASPPVQVNMREFSITPGVINITKGGSLDIRNSGTMPHNLNVTGANLKSAEIAPGGRAVLDLAGLAPGSYEVFCAVAGHKDSGMKATLVVGSASGTTAGGRASSGADQSSMAGMDMSNMVPGSAQAKAMNAQMEKDMTSGVSSFLAWAKKYATGAVKSGNQKLVPQVMADGTKRFTLTARITDWEVSPGKVVKAWTYNGIVPGPWIRVQPGDKVEVVLHNELPISTDIHWHGIDVPNAMDGVAGITQAYIEPGATYTYKFTAPAQPELGMYHAHMHGQVAIVNGLFAAVQVGDIALPRGRTIAGITVPNDLKVTQEIPMVLNDAGVIGLTLNGKAFPETAPIAAKKGDWILIDYFNEGLQGHPMHLHRQPQLVVAKDGFPLEQPYRADTVFVAPGERYSVLVKADEIGTWAWHCHIVSHAENDQGLTGMVTALIVS